MSTPILATKLYRPPLRPDRVPRPRLTGQLNAGLHRKLTLVSAPAGFGKTTLISEWLEDLQLTNDDSREDAAEEHPIVNPKSKIANRTAWLSLDEGDNEPTRFWSYLIAALQTVAPDVGERAVRLLHSPQPPPVETVLTTLLNEIAASSGKHILVLDDYHVVDSQPIDRALTFLLEHLPPTLHLVIATREDPLLPLARLRARDELTELRATELRFTPAEAADFLNEVMGLSLSTEEIAALEGRTEGWIAGLQLAALSMHGRDDVAHFIAAFAGDNRYVVDYLAEEVLQRQPDDVRRFLLQTSILNRLSGSLCSAVTRQESSGALLTSLEHANLFVVPLDDKRHWYRYHHLFADVLHARLLEEQPHLVPALHGRASVWHERHDLPDKAIHHALAAKDFERAATLIERVWPALHRSRYRSATSLGWMRALPEDLVRARPLLSTAYAWELLNAGEFEFAEVWLRDAERGLATADAAPGEMDESHWRLLPSLIATARAYLAQSLGDAPGTVRYAQQALDHLPADDYVGRGPAAALLGLAHWASGDLDAAHRALADAMENFRLAGNILFAISGTYGMADICLAQGRLRGAVRTYEASLRLAGDTQVQGTADLYLGLGDLRREQGDLDAAADLLQQSAELSERAALQTWPFRFRIAQACLKQTQGDFDGALALLDEAERRYFHGPVPNLRPIPALRARVWVAQGNLDNALAWARERTLSPYDELDYLHEFEHITLARLLLAQHGQDRQAHHLQAHHLDDAQSLLARLLEAAEAGSRTGSALEIWVLQALAHQARGDIDAALAALERALELAEPEGYVRLFVDEGPPMAHLLRAAAARGIAPAYVRKLLNHFPDSTVASSTRSPASKPQLPLIEPLSERELEVLHLIAQGLSNREIGERLFLALSTVKGHNRNIFGKLQVQRRTEAVARARALGLL